jgi:hypothetical protein
MARLEMAAALAVLHDLFVMETLIDFNSAMISLPVWAFNKRLVK